MRDGAQHSGVGPDQGKRWAVAGVTLAANLGSFAFLVIVARASSPVVLGGFVALGALALLFEVPANALQAAVASSPSGDSVVAGGPRAGDQPVARGFARGAVVATAWGAGAGALVIALSPLVAAFLH
ncbi:MAG: hypothetical protein M1435_02650, partial [Actinobacteria bacterium]|nr:hypothetical protein [Actinomycetota bacterium]